MLFYGLLPYIKFQEPILSGASVAKTSRVRASAMLFISDCAKYGVPGLGLSPQIYQNRSRGLTDMSPVCEFRLSTACKQHILRKTR
jgi:hypothetical protein